MSLKDLLAVAFGLGTQRAIEEHRAVKRELDDLHADNARIRAAVEDAPRWISERLRR